MNLKITDIAKYAGVSPAAVSRVLHNNGYVAREKRERIEKALKELRYIPNMVARGLKRQKTGMIGHILLSAQPANPFFTEILRGVDMAAYDRGYHVLTLCSYNDPEREKDLVNEMMSRMVDGIIFSVAASSDNVQRTIEMGIPTVMIERPFDVFGIDKILVDNFEGSYLATKYLVKRNHHRIAYIGKKKEYEVEKERFQGYIKALEEEKIVPPESHIKFVDDYIADFGFEAAKQIFQEKDRPTAIFITSDILACGVLQFLYHSQIRIPDDVSIIGYDDTYANLLTPKLTAVAVPMSDMGMTAVNLLIDKLNNKINNVITITLHTTLIERESVKNI